MLTGPPSAGKPHLARRMFPLINSRHERHGDFVAVNGATLRVDVAASAALSHKKSVFTSAAFDRAGLLRTAAAGLLFLDEIDLDEQTIPLKTV